MSSSEPRNRRQFDLTGKKALVTGGAVGVGRACAIALAEAGAAVAIVGRNEETGRTTADMLRQLSGDSLFVRCDISAPSDVSAMMQAVAGYFGRLDIAVNNAGIYRPGRDESFSKQDWDDVIGVNLTGTWLCAQAELRQMVEQRPMAGKIINIASIAGSVVCSNGAYDASKAAVVHLTKTLATRWGAYNVTVNSISPGHVVGGQATRSSEEQQRLRDLTPVGYTQRFEDLHGPVVFLASEASNYVTGHDLVVDGGYTLSRWTELPRRVVRPSTDADVESEAEMDLGVQDTEQ